MRARNLTKRLQLLPITAPPTFDHDVAPTPSRIGNTRATMLANPIYSITYCLRGNVPKTPSTNNVTTNAKMPKLRMDCRYELIVWRVILAATASGLNGVDLEDLEVESLISKEVGSFLSDNPHPHSGKNTEPHVQSQSAHAARSAARTSSIPTR